MKNNKGFTLVELLGVLIILVVIFVIAFPSITSLIDNAQSGIDDATKELIFDATKDYMKSKPDIYIENQSNVYCISFEQLINNGHITSNQIVNVDEKYSTVKVKYDKDLKKEMELGGDNCSEVLSNARLVLNGLKDVKLKLVSDGSISTYVEDGLLFYKSSSEEPIELNFSLGSNLIDGLIVTSKSSNTGKTIACSENINCLSQISIDVYTLRYEYYASDNKKYVAERTVKIVDDDAPIITIRNPEETISVNTKTYDIKNGVSVTDNSGEVLEIKAKTNLSLGQVGTYIITYTATDSSGNTASATKKVIISE